MDLDLVTLDQAKRQVKLPLDDTYQDDEMLPLLTVAHAIIADYLESTDTTWLAVMDAWTEDTLPGYIRIAILLQFAELWRYRGDEAEQPVREPGHLSPMIRAFLARSRMPVLS